jgi:hypothetical protein
MAGAQAFNQRFFSSDEKNAAVFESLNARMLRYEMGWAFYEGLQYNSISSFAQGFKVQQGLYKYIANLYNPTARIGDFYKGVIWGGNLDPNADDKGAIPITIGDSADEEKLRAAIAKGWLNSSWDTNKSAHILHGTILGDAAIYVRDDMTHDQIRIELLHPSLLKYVSMDARGFVKGYVIEEQRKDENGRLALYRETCEHGEGEEIIFKTYRNNSPYAWEGNVDSAGNPRYEWVELYGFVPLVLTQHINEARAWGRAEVHPYIGKIASIDDQASILNDSIRRVIDPDYQVNIKKSDTEISFTSGTPTTNNPMPGREQRKIFYLNKDTALIQPILVPIQIAEASANILQMLTGLESDLPELRDDISSNVAEGTLIAARSRVESKVIERRANYNRGIVRANQMLIAISGYRGYDGFDGFNLDSFSAGKLDHSVSPRPVFPETEAQALDRKIKIWTAAADVSQKTQNMIPAETVLKDLGMTDEEIKDMPTARMNAINILQADNVPPDGISL